MNIEKIIREMTVEEKAVLCSGKSTFLTKQNKKYNIPMLLMANGSYGLVVSRSTEMMKETESVQSSLMEYVGTVRPSTSFPCSTAIACTWNTDLVFEVGRALGEECNAAGVQVLLGPGINIKRTPLCGRNFEYYSEDPYLTAEIGIACVNGVQEQDVAVSLKHYALNNTEKRRFMLDTIADERTMREIYLAAFENIIKKAKPMTVMAAYNLVNGKHATENRYLLTKVLRDEWGFDGLIMSDWGAIEDCVEAQDAGCNMIMPGPAPQSDQKIVQAVRDGRLPLEKLDRSVRRLLKLIERLPEKTGQPANHEKHHRLAVKVAGESIVLLKNDGLLPWDAKKVTSLAVIGECAKKSNYLLGGSASIVPTKMDEPLDALKRHLEGSAKVSYAPGYDTSDGINPALIEEAKKTAAGCNCALLIVRTGIYDYSEGNEREDIRLPEQQIRLIREVTNAQPNTVVAVICGSAYETASWGKNVRALLSLWHPGQGVGEALKNILFGITNPSGRLAETFPVKLADTPAYINATMNNNKIYYGENIFVGYRYYDKKQMDVSFPFGHGLSYTQFEYSDLRIDRSEWASLNRITVRLNVKNTGKAAGKEIVQLYVKDTESFLPRPEKELKGFKKIFLKPGEEKEAAFTLEKSNFSFYSPEKGAWVAEEGEYELMAGASSRDIRLSEKMVLSPADKLKGSLGKESLIVEWMADERGREILLSELKGLEPVFLDKNNPIHPLAMTIPLRQLVKNGFIAPEQLSSILEKFKTSQDRSML